MAEFRVEYQDTPFNYTQSATLIVEAEGRASAFVTAYDALTRRGHVVAAYAHYLKETGLTPEEQELVYAAGVPRDKYGATHIRGIEEHAVLVAGKVIGG